MDIESIFNSTCHYYLPLEKGRAFHFNKLESLYPRCFCDKFGSNCTSGPRSGEKDLQMPSMYFY